MTQKRKRRHHIVPQFLLRQFADEDGNVTVYDQELEKEWTTSTRKIAVERDFYTVDTHDGPSDIAEDALAKLEGEACSALGRLLSGVFPPTREDREMISAFLAVQLTRGRHLRSVVNTAASQMMTMTARLYAEHPKGLKKLMIESGINTNPTDADVEEMAAEFHEMDVNVGMPNNFFVRSMFEPLPDFIPFFANRHWMLVEGSDFVITDEPINLISHRPHSFFGAGLMTADEIVVVLSPTRALALLHPPELTGKNPGPERQVKLPTDQLANWRRGLWSGAHRFVFRRPSTPRPCAG